MGEDWLGQLARLCLVIMAGVSPFYILLGHFLLQRYMFVSCCYPVHFTTELIYQNEFHIQHGKHVMCLLVSLLECGQNIGEQYRVIQW